MLNALKKWLKPKTAESISVHKIETFDISEIANHPLGIDQILRGEKDGYVIRNVFSSTECQNLLDGLLNLRKDETVKINDGFVSYPKSFAQFQQTAEQNPSIEESYFSESINFRKSFPERFGVDLEQRIIRLINQLGKKAAVPTDKKKHGSFIPFSFRKLGANGGRIKAHCENFFFLEFPGFFERFKHFTDNKNQLSFFLVVQKSENGGELTLYKANWEDTKIRLNDTTIQNEKGITFNLEDKNAIETTTLNPPAGSVVIFSGGNIWHRVEAVTGPNSRVTIGGFLSFSPDKECLFLWS